MVLMPLLSRLLTLLVILTMPLFLARLTLIPIKSLSICRSEERFSRNAETDLVCRLLLEKKKVDSCERERPTNTNVGPGHLAQESPCEHARSDRLTDEPQA